MSDESDSFLELLDKPFSWPAEGGRIFSTSENWRQNAQIAEGYDCSIVIEDGYKRAGDILVEHALSHGGGKDFLVYPILFCFRHYLELAIKNFLNTHGDIKGIKANTSSHNFEELWPDCRCLLQEIFSVGNDDESLLIAENYIAEFSKIDPNSFHFRYPTDRKGNRISLDIKEVDLVNLRNSMDYLHTVFWGADAQLDSLI